MGLAVRLMGIVARRQKDRGNRGGDVNAGVASRNLEAGRKVVAAIDGD